MAERVLVEKWKNMAGELFDTMEEAECSDKSRGLTIYIHQGTSLSLDEAEEVARYLVKHYAVARKD